MTKNLEYISNMIERLFNINVSVPFGDPWAVEQLMSMYPVCSSAKSLSLFKTRKQHDVWTNFFVLVGWVFVY